MTEAKIYGQYNNALFTIFDSSLMQKLAKEEFITEKVFKYLISIDYNGRKSKTYLEF